MPAPAAQIPGDRPLSRWAGLPLLLLLLAIALCLMLDPRGVFQPPWLLPILGFVFSGVISIVVAYLAFRSYLAGGSGSVLLLGCGMLTFGLSNTMGSLVSDLHDPNVGVAFFNIAVMIAGFCHLGSAVWATAASRPSRRRLRGRLFPVLAYTAILLFLTLLLQAIQAHQLPTFFIQGQGPTPIRQVVLGTAILLFALAATQFWALARRAERAFFRWYGLGLGLIAVGLVGVYFQKAVGTPLNWVGRSAQYLGGVYILVALLPVLQDRGVPLGKALAIFFGEAETEYRPLVEAAKDAILSLDANGHILYWNEGATHLFGYTAAEAFGAHLMALVAPLGTEERLQKAWDRLPRTAEGQMIGTTLESELAAKGGRLFWAELSFYAQPSTRGSLTACIVRDITERKQAEAALREANATLESRVRERTAALEEDITERKRAEGALERVAEFPNENPNPVLRVARDGTLLYANRESAPLLTLWERQVGQRLPDDWCARMAAAYEAGQVQEVDVACESRIFSCLLTPIAERGYINIYGRDITKRKVAEAALQQLNAELEARVTQRTAELSDAFLKVSLQSEQLRSLASELTLVEQRERSRLAELIHDGLQQLLVSAKLRVTLVERAQDPNARQDCQEIGRLLDEAVADARSLTAELSPPILRTGGLLAGLEWLARWNEEKHHLTVHMQAPAAPLPPLPEDLTVLLFQSVRELLFNTVKYAQVPKAQVTLAAKEEGLTLTVADAGAGFDPSSLRGEGGVAGGFGLARIRHRLELLGGCMDINSAPGHGSRITLAVPLRMTEQRPAAPQHPQTNSVPRVDVAPGLESTRRIRVLIVDDHQVIRQALARMLGTEVDIEVVGEAGTGTAAVALARQLSPDVVLMDINMPEMNGIDATRAIHTAFPAMRVIGLSMFERGDQQSAMQDAGAVDYVSKSGPVEALLAAIRGGR